jgi:hypothetical protein
MTPPYGRSANSALHAMVEILILEVVEMLEAHRGRLGRQSAASMMVDLARTC